MKIKNEIQGLEFSIEEGKKKKREAKPGLGILCSVCPPLRETKLWPLTLCTFTEGK